MKRFHHLCGLLTALSLSVTGCISPKPQASAILKTVPTGAVSPRPETLEYRIQPGDQLDIKFYYNPELNDSIPVRPDGKISLQLIDDVQAAGLTPMDLDALLTKAYAGELKSPEVTVIVRSFSSNAIWVGGEVGKPGLIPLSYDMTALHAVFSAGGFLETAKPEASIVIRKGADNQPVPIAIDLLSVMKGGKTTAPDQRLLPNDIVYVPKSAIAEANKFVHQYIENLLLFKGVSFGFNYDIRDTND